MLLFYETLIKFAFEQDILTDLPIETDKNYIYYYTFYVENNIQTVSSVWHTHIINFIGLDHYYYILFELVYYQPDNHFFTLETSENFAIFSQDIDKKRGRRWWRCTLQNRRKTDYALSQIKSVNWFHIPTTCIMRRANTPMAAYRKCLNDAKNPDTF